LLVGAAESEIISHQRKGKTYIVKVNAYCSLALSGGEETSLREGTEVTTSHIGRRGGYSSNRGSPAAIGPSLARVNFSHQTERLLYKYFSLNSRKEGGKAENLYCA